MAEPLSAERFAALADAYGAIARWPEADREAGWRMAEQPEFAAMLADAEALDARLNLWRVPSPSPALRETIIARRGRPLSRRIRAWWAGLGIATALAGAAAGSLAAAAVPTDHAAGEEATAFGNIAGQEE